MARPSKPTAVKLLEGTVKNPHLGSYADKSKFHHPPPVFPGLNTDVTSKPPVAN